MYQLHYVLREEYFTRRKLDMSSFVMLEAEIYMPVASAWVFIDRTAHEKVLLAHMPNR
jgi:hypothetical protein